MEKKRLNLTLSPDLWKKLRAVMYKKERPANYLIEQALRAYLPTQRSAGEIIRERDSE